MFRSTENKWIQQHFVLNYLTCYTKGVQVLELCFSKTQMKSSVKHRMKLRIKERINGYGLT